MSDKTLPVAEIFTSPQGEGRFCGTLMTFVRLAGCTVGRPYTKDARETLGLNIYQEKCVDWTGTGFACDTNFVSKRKMTVDEILKEVDVLDICLTGGEPLMHDLQPLLLAAYSAGRHVHLETSGTIDLPVYEPHWINPWLTVSPKYGYLRSMIEEADELKILVGVDFNEKKFVAEFIGDLDKVYLQPINDEHTLNMSNVRRCLDLQMKYPRVKISTQMHKVWSVR